MVFRWALGLSILLHVGLIGMISISPSHHPVDGTSARSLLWLETRSLSPITSAARPSRPISLPSSEKGTLPLQAPGVQTGVASPIRSQSELRSLLSAQDYAPMPAYAHQAKEMQIEGVVKVSFQTDAQGHVVESGIRVVASSGESSLDQSVLKTIPSWTLSSLPNRDFELEFIFRL